KHPQVSLRIMVGDRTTVAEMFALGHADLAIAYNLPDDTRLQRAAEFHPPQEVVGIPVGKPVRRRPPNSAMRWEPSSRRARRDACRQNRANVP
ncbi:hypothetical protein ACC745_38175, partial [Rhizobium ruizarguesonis]